MACQSQTSEGLGNASVDRRTAFVDDVEARVRDIVVFQLILALHERSDENGVVLGRYERDCV